METIIIKIVPNSLPIQSAALYINENKITINNTTQTRIQVFAGKNSVRINDLGVKLMPTFITVYEGEVKNIFVGLRKQPASPDDKNFLEFIWHKFESLLGLDLQFYLMEGLGS
ncbi:hypothetical protein [Hymenobacter terricola]|uniref:hypothetical protein n=1 Tax=Hymenobacter terricola TaxID=2819236 RepID=UPI001B317DC2|nr:hypothetical protein [Hymenobacter terricola]